jgi:hypothetical protein
MKPELELIATATATLAEPFSIGAADAGLRAAIPISGGVVAGSLLNGRIEPGGVDWCLTRADGVAEVWARYAIRCDDGANVMVTNAGPVHPQPDGTYAGVTVPQFECGAPGYEWTRHSVFACALLAAADGRSVRLEFYRLR